MVECMSAPAPFSAAGSLRKLLLASLTIAAILLGLVAMHALSARADTQSGHATHSQTSSGPHTRPQMTPDSNDTASPAIASALVAISAVVSIQGSSDLLPMNCLLVGMVCALRLLVALMGLGLSKRPSPLVSGIRRVMRIPRIVSSKFVVPTALSLDSLSISRT